MGSIFAAVAHLVASIIDYVNEKNASEHSNSKD